MAPAATLPVPHLDARLFGARRLSALTDEALFEPWWIEVSDNYIYAALNLGGHVGDDPAAVARNRELLLEALGAGEAALVVPSQVHGDEIVEVASAEPGAVEAVRARALEGADGLLVDVPQIAALLCFADCVPVVLASPTGRFAVVHAGWRGAVAGIAGKAARLLAARDAAELGIALPAAAAALNAYLGPHIHAECFETGADVRARFVDRYGADVAPDGRHVDLARALACDLGGAGLAAERIADAGACTTTTSPTARRAAPAAAMAPSPCCRKDRAMGIEQRYANVAAEVAAVCREAGRDPAEVTVVAVSKTVGPDAVARALAAGARDFGENRPDGLAEKAAAFPQATWHFIGNIQSRRIPDIVRSAALVHSLFEERHARKIDEAAAAAGKVQDVLLEVNVSGEESKGGLAPGDVRALLDVCARLPHVRVRGLMTMAPQGDPAAARAVFEGLANLHAQLRAGLDPAQAALFDGLSMGMSEDWREAVRAGATIVRIGRAVFDDAFEA